MLSNEMLRAFGVTDLNEAAPGLAAPLGVPVKREASLIDAMNWSIEAGRMRLCDILVLGNYPLKCAGIDSALSLTEKPL